MADILTGLSFQDETLKNIEHPEEQFEKKEFENCRFSNCNFSASSFQSCYFENCLFEDCNLSTIQVEDSLFRDVTFKDCKLMGILWSEVRKKGFSQSIRFQTSVLNYSSFYSLDMQKCSFADCQAVEVDFTEANLSKLVLHQMDLSGATFYRTNLKGTDLTTAVNYLFNPADNFVKDMLVSLPDAVNLLYPFGIKVSL